MDSSTAATVSSSSNHNGQLLDLADLDGYLLSLLSNEIVEAFRYALMVKKFILGAVAVGASNSNSNENSNLNENSNEIAGAAMDESSTTVRGESSPTYSPSWWQWEDLLAFATIWASHGQTPGARALGFDLVESSKSHSPQRRSSFWWWIARAARSNSTSNNNNNNSNNNNDNDNNSNKNTNNTFRNKIIIYAVLRIVLPRLYERIKSKGLDYAESFDGDATEKEEDQQQEQQLSLRLQLQPNQRTRTDKADGFGNSDSLVETERELPSVGSSVSDPSTEIAAAAAAIRRLALQRRKHVVRTLLQWLDGAILPSMRLVLLLLCWTGNDSGHGGSLALWMSGLSYQQSQQHQSPSNDSTPSTTTTKTNNSANGSLAITTLPLFVLYAHRRWFHREAMELIWNQVGRSLLFVQQETSDMGSSVGSALATEWRMLVVRWSYQLDKLSKKVFPKNLNPNDNENENEESCSLCGTNKVVVPYRLVECCGKVACYVCLWDRLASTTTKTSDSSERIPCPICYENISRCEPVRWN